jgi:site-specific DNA-methyltransferase (adenine-specific)
MQEWNTLSRDWKNQLYFGDNLDILRDYVSTRSIDLVYLDPPFNSNANYNVLFKEKSGEKSAAQITAFEDTWHWSDDAEAAYHELLTEGPERVSELMQAFRSFLGMSDMMAYLTMMAVRLVELHRVLKETGSIYLHCDPTASHYLKILMDAIYGPVNFRSEVIWKRTSAHSSARRYGPVHDTILFYSKSDKYTWNQSYQPYDQTYLDEFYTHEDPDGRRWRRSDLTGAGIRHGATGGAWRGIDVTAKGRHWFVPPAELDKLDAQGRIHWPSKEGGVPMLKRYLDEQPGVPLQDVWTDLPPLHNLAAERLGYPTQKPEALLERIIKAGSDEGDVVLDPFCGCGTAVAVAERLGRRWVGIDITHLAINLMKHRLHDAFGAELAPYEVIGEPTDLAGARALAEEDRYKFQWWALSLVRARPAQDRKKGADSGIDGMLTFFDDKSGKARRVLVQVKSGKVNAAQIRDLRGTVERDCAAIGAFITLEPPTKPMLKEAASAGFYVSPHYGKFPKLQILTVEELLGGASLQYPHMNTSTFKKAARQRKPPEVQPQLEGLFSKD